MRNQTVAARVPRMVAQGLNISVAMSSNSYSDRSLKKSSLLGEVVVASCRAEGCLVGNEVRNDGLA